jgi:hypothetical protein
MMEEESMEMERRRRRRKAMLARVLLRRKEAGERGFGPAGIALLQAEMMLATEKGSRSARVQTEGEEPKLPEMGEPRSMQEPKEAEQQGPRP